MNRGEDLLPHQFKNEKRSRVECQRWAKATCSVHGSPLGWRDESNLHLHLTQVQVFDFHELRQGFIPPIQR